MQKKDKKIPEEFKTYEEAAEFWESHDSTEYLDILEEVEIIVDIQKRHYLIELDEKSARLLQEDAKKKGISANYLASKLVEKELAGTWIIFTNVFHRVAWNA